MSRRRLRLGAARTHFELRVVGDAVDRAANYYRNRCGAAAIAPKEPQRGPHCGYHNRQHASHLRPPGRHRRPNTIAKIRNIGSPFQRLNSGSLLRREGEPEITVTPPIGTWASDHCPLRHRLAVRPIAGRDENTGFFACPRSYRPTFEAPKCTLSAPCLGFRRRRPR